jgi:beta-alanine--pyruvate transaminase
VRTKQAGVDVDPKVVGFNGYEWQKRLFDRGVHVKTTGNCAILAPPFIATNDEVDYVIEIMKETLTT